MHRIAGIVRRHAPLVLVPNTCTHPSDEDERGLSFMIVLFYGSATTEQITGRPIDDNKVNMIVDGKTTELQIISLFGAPDNTSKLSKHNLYIYRYCITKGKGVSTGYTTDMKSKSSCDELTVTFDTLGVVIAHSYLKDPTIKRK